MADKDRIAIWDNIKFFLIFLVVLGHFASLAGEYFNISSSIDLIITSFHVPFFIFIAGLFYKDTGIKEKILSFLAIYVVLKAVFLIVYLINGWSADYQLFYSGGLPWFMFALAAFYLLNYLFRNQNKFFILIISIVIAVFVGYDNTISTFLTLNRIITFYPFFLAASMINRDKLENLIKKPTLKLTGLIIFVIWCILCFVCHNQIYGVRGILTGGSTYSILPIPEYGALYRMMCYIINVIVGLSFIFIIPTRRLGFITTFGRRTIQVFFWHFVILDLILGSHIHESYFFKSTTGMILWLLIGVVLTFVLSLKIFQYPTCWLMPKYIKNISEYSVNKKKAITAAAVFIGLTAALLLAIVVINPKDWKEKNGNWYYENFFGIKSTGWIEADNHTYYLNEDGVMVTGEQIIDGEKYVFDDNGALTDQ